MVNWQSSLWKRWIIRIQGVASVGRRFHGWSSRRRRAAGCRFGLECLEDRLVPALVSVSVVPFYDFVSISSNAPVSIDVLANDFDPDGTLDASSLTISSGPSRGTVTVQQTDAGPVVLYTPGPSVSRLVVDDPRDVNDGDYSRGHLSLREAILLANADTDSFTSRGSSTTSRLTDGPGV